MPIKSLTRATLAVAACVLVAVSGAAAAADLQAGEAKVKQICQACHGLDGNTPIAENPTLGGQYPDYLAKALRDYKSGLRKSPMMTGMALTLSAQDVENIAAYYAAQPAVLVTRH